MVSISLFFACAMSSLKQRTQIRASMLSLPFSTAGTAREWAAWHSRPVRLGPSHNGGSEDVGSASMQQSSLCRDCAAAPAQHDLRL